MNLDSEMSLERAEHFERLAAIAPSNVLRCRYLSMARYWSILSSDRSACPSHANRIHGSRSRDGRRVSQVAQLKEYRR